jgi:hypothetical protein
MRALVRQEHIKYKNVYPLWVFYMNRKFIFIFIVLIIAITSFVLVRKNKVLDHNSISLQRLSGIKYT